MSTNTDFSARRPEQDARMQHSGMQKTLPATAARPRAGVPSRTLHLFVSPSPDDPREATFCLQLRQLPAQHLCPLPFGCPCSPQHFHFHSSFTRVPGEDMAPPELGSPGIMALGTQRLQECFLRKPPSVPCCPHRGGRFLLASPLPRSPKGFPVAYCR